MLGFFCVVNGSVFYMDFCPWTDGILRSTYAGGSHCIFSLQEVYESCTITALIIFLPRCFFVSYTSLGQRKLWITALEGERLGEYVDVMVIQLVEWFRKWNESAKCSTWEAVSTCKFSALLRYQPGTNKISAENSWAGNKRQRCHWLRTVNMTW